MEEKPKLPPFASGRIAGSYSLLFEYWRVARERGREDLVEKAMLSDEDYRRLREIASQGERVRLTDLLDELVDYFMERVDEELAGEAAGRLGYRISGSDARRLIARLLASWLVEAGEYWNIIRIKS